MIAKIIALIINEVVQEYRNLQPEAHPDESVLSFSTALNPKQTIDTPVDEMSANIGFNWAVSKDAR